MAELSLEWTPAISVGIPAIDSQHQELFAQVNSLMAALSSGKGKQEVGKAIAFLQDYVIRHFGLEDSYMERYGFPGYAMHKAQHDRFVEDIHALKRTYEAEGASIRVAMEVQKRIGEWLITHINRSDRELAEFLAGKI